MGNPDCHSFSSSTVMTMTSGPDGRPQVCAACHTRALNRYLLNLFANLVKIVSSILFRTLVTIRLTCKVEFFVTVSVNIQFDPQKIVNSEIYCTVSP